METTKKTTSFLEVILFDQSDAMSDSLGMTEERFHELNDKVNEILEDDNIEKHTQSLHNLSLKVKHANELALVCYMYGIKMGRKEGVAKVLEDMPSLLKTLERGINPSDDSDKGSDL